MKSRLAYYPASGERGSLGFLKPEPRENIISRPWEREVALKCRWKRVELAEKR